MQNELQHIISGKSKIRYGENIQVAISYLRASEKSGTLGKTDKHFKSEKTARLKNYIETHRLWRTDIAVEQFINSNGFQKIRNNDYFNSKLGIILEDLHDENVLTYKGVLYFILNNQKNRMNK